MAFKDLVEAIDSDKTNRDRLIAVYIGILAVLLAVCGVGGGNAMKDATARNIEASNTWAFFQAKNIRRHELRLQIGEFEVLLASDPQLPEAARKLIDEKIAKYRKDEARLTSEPETGEGVNELLVKGKALEVQRDRAMLKDPFFDYGQALLQSRHRAGFDRHHHGRDEPTGVKRPPGGPRHRLDAERLLSVLRGALRLSCPPLAAEMASS